MKRHELGNSADPWQVVPLTQALPAVSGIAVVHVGLADTGLH